MPRVAQAVLWSLRYPQFTARAHARYGPTFTLRPGTMPPIVLTTDRDAVKRLFTGDPLVRHHGNEATRPLIGERSVILLEPQEHLARRKLLLPPFHGDRVRGYADLMQRLIDRELDGWRAGDVKAVLPIAQNLTMDVILQAVLGVADPAMRTRLRERIEDVLAYPFGPLNRRLARRPARASRLPVRAREALATVARLPTPAVTTYFPQLKSRSAWNVGTIRWWRHADELNELLDAQVVATLNDPRLDERDDILAMLVQARDEDGNALTREDLRDELLALIGAGHETTAAAIAWGAEFLAHDDAVRERAREANGDYLDALVKEVLRLRSPLGASSVRVLDEPFEIGGHTIPAGVPILINGWGLHHDPSLYPEPGAFRPERFLGRAPESYTWLPFGGGAHRCLGAALAELEMKVALGALLRRVDFTSADREPAPAARRGVVVIPLGGARIRVVGLREPAPGS
jgi:cytochrome P450